MKHFVFNFYNRLDQIAETGGVQRKRKLVIAGEEMGSYEIMHDLPDIRVGLPRVEKRMDLGVCAVSGGPVSAGC